jgi:hypothetical protein
MKHAQNLVGHKYLRMALDLDNPTYAEIGKLAHVSVQAVHDALKLAQVDIKPIKRSKERERRREIDRLADQAFIQAVKALPVDTRTLRPSDLARLAGQPGYKRARQALLAAQIPFTQPRQGWPTSDLVLFAQTLPDSSKLTAKEICHLAGVKHRNPAQTLHRNGIPFRAIPLGKYAWRAKLPII